MANLDHDRRLIGRCAIAAGLAATCLALPRPAAAQDAAALEAAWRTTIAQTPLPSAGCFQADYPDAVWTPVACVEAPQIPYVPRSGSARGETVGNGHDYAAAVTGLLSSATGSFPKEKGVTSETDGGANVYSIQLNSNFMTTAICNGHNGCLSWQQFVYSSSSRAAFMQYWLINWNATCPNGWFTFSNDCYTNSSAVGVPQFAITKLKTMTLTGSATLNGTDVLTFMQATHAYSTSGPDSMVDLATGWNQSEFNVIGDGGGSQANFNAGSKLTVKIAVNNGTSSTPTCLANAGTTGETNNLNLGACTAFGGATPYVQFTESN
jgi:hypothetical protein